MRSRLLFFSVALVASITLKPIPITAQQSDAQQNVDKAKPPSNSKTATEQPQQPPPSTASLPAADTGQGGTRASDDKNKSGNDDIQRQIAGDTKRMADYTFWLVAVGSIVGALQIGVFILQALYTGRAAGAAQVSAYAAKKSADMAEAAVRLTERADILLDAVSFEANNPLPDVILRVKNFGRTRAIDTRIDCKLIVIPPKNGFVPNREPMCATEGPLTIGAGDGQNIRFSGLHGWFVEFHGSVMRGLIGLRVELAVSYRDVFDKPHRTIAEGSFMPQSRTFRIDRNESD